MDSIDHARLRLLLALADDELVIGHRHSEWTGWAPMIEADLAFSSIAQDEIAHAQLLYELAEPLDGRSADDLALGRPPSGYTNAIACERINHEWAYTLARQYLYDTADDVRLASLEKSRWTTLTNAIAVIRLEERFHLEHARNWCGRLAAYPAMQRGVEEAARDISGLFEPLWEEQALLADGTLPQSSAALLDEFTKRVTTELEAMGFVSPEIKPGGSGGRAGNHTDEFNQLWDDLTGLYRAHAGATW